MSEKTTKKPLAIALGAAFITSLTAIPVVNAAENPFAMSELSSGYMVAEMAEGKCGGDKAAAEGDKAAAEGKCGGDKAAAEGDKAAVEGKCGEGKCGGENKTKAEGKCGEGKCGGDKK
jgi:uncharacterized low-complexity protein